MKRVAMILRSTAFTAKGGDTMQALHTATALAKHGFAVDVKCTDEEIDYSQYALLHFFNVIRPADILYHTAKTNLPYAVSTIFVDYGEYDKNQRKGLSGFLFRFLSSHNIEYIKTLARRIKGNDKIMYAAYIRLGQKKAVEKVLNNAALLLPNSLSEYRRLKHAYLFDTDHTVIPNGADTGLFVFNKEAVKDPALIICAARVEGIKNQLNLIKALNNTEFKLMIIGNASPNQQHYMEECRRTAASNISFAAHMPQEELAKYYAGAKVHVLPSWFETTGLSSVEAAAMGCNIVITDKGDAKEYFGEDAFYCCPSSPAGIYKAIKQAAAAENNSRLHTKIIQEYTWQKAALLTAGAYKKILHTACD